MRLERYFRNKTFIIAEAGINHNGKLSVAKKLVDVAAQAGADAVKFQIFDPKELVTKNAKLAAYQKRSGTVSSNQFEMLTSLALADQDFAKLAVYAKAKGVIFLATPFDPKSADVLVHLEVPLLKVSSGDLTNLPFLSYLSGKKLPIILSTGMADLGEIEAAIKTIESKNNLDLALLHCVTDYPAEFRELNLLAIHTLDSAFRYPVGFSDHSLGTEASVAAVSMGAVIIEKHFTLDQNLPGPDHRASLEPKELSDLVRMIRNIEQALGDGIKRPSPAEEKIKKLVRRSLVASRNIQKGQKIGQNDLVVKRPGTGIPPELLDWVVGKKAVQDIAQDEMISWRHLNA